MVHRSFMLTLIGLTLIFANRLVAAADVAARNPKPSISIDASRTGAPISPYIYGQFIEHLGRCIYGGIWAEMLEDRKFFDAVGSDPSPWKPISAGTTVEMVRDNAFVGEHTPRVLPGNSPRGIMQDGLGLRRGRSYSGRVWLAGDGESGPVSVSLVWGDGADRRQTVTIENLKADYSRFPLRFTCGGDTDNGRLEIVAAGGDGFFVGTVSLMPEGNVHGMRADTLEVLRQLDAPVYRWPGGNFVSGYDWRDGIGDPDRRPPRKNPAWKGIEHNDFGLDEFMTFCRLLKTEPLVVVNSGQGDVKLAVDELQYANGGTDMPQGKLREKNGCREPYGVKWWGVGNEMYGKWQLGYMPLEAYTRKHNAFADAMRGADPSIRLIAVGHVGPWSEAMLTHCADRMDWISEHFYVGEKPDVMAHVRQAPARVRAIADAHRRYRDEIAALADKEIPIALDEWNYWYGPHLYGELGTRYFLKDALGVAAALNEFARQSDMYFMANYAQTVNVIGCIKTTKTDAAFDTTGLPLMLYRKHLGTVPVETVAGGPLDAVAAWSENRKTLTLAVVNPMTEELAVPLSVAGARLAGTGHVREISGSDPMAYNEPGKPPAVAIRERELKGAADMLTIPPLSISLFTFDVSDPMP